MAGDFSDGVAGHSLTSWPQKTARRLGL